MKIYVIMYGNKKEAGIGQRENWLALERMGLAVRSDFLNLSIGIVNEIKLLHLTPSDWQRLYGLKIEGWRTSGTFLADDEQAILDKLDRLKRR